MSINPKLAHAIAIFQELGWDNATEAEATTLPLGSTEQRKQALAGLRTGELATFGEIAPNTYGTITHHQVDSAMLTLFAIRLGITANRAAQMLTRQQPAPLFAVIQQRDDTFAENFVAAVCRSNRRAWTHSLSSYGDIAVNLVIDRKLPIPENLEYFKDWAAITAHVLAGEKLEHTSYELLLPELKALRASFRQHLTKGIAIGVPATGPFGSLVTAGVNHNLLSYSEARQLAFQALESAQRPGDRKRWVTVLLDELDTTPQELAAYATTLVPLLGTGEPVLIERLGIGMLPIVEKHLFPELALSLLYASSAKSLTVVLRALSDVAQPDQEAAAILAPRLQELAAHRDPKIHVPATKLLHSWNLQPEPTVTDAPPKLWQPTPPLWQVPRLAITEDDSEPTAQTLVVALRSLTVGVSDHIATAPLEQFWAQLIALAYQDPAAAKRVLLSSGKNLVDSALVEWARTDTRTPWQQWSETNVVEARNDALVAHIGEMPCVVSQPSWVDLSIDFADLIHRLNQYQRLNLPVLAPDLALALMRLHPLHPDVEQARSITVPVKLSETTFLNRTAGDVIVDHLTENTSQSLAGFPKYTVQSPEDALWWYDEVRYDNAVASLQLACRRHPLPPTAAINLLGVQRPQKPEIAAACRSAVIAAWDRGLLQPGVADIRYLDGHSELSAIPSFVHALRELADSGMLSIVWPVLDDILSYSDAQLRLIAGTAQAAEAMADYAPAVKAAVASGLAPEAALQVPGLRAIAARSGKSKAVLAAREAVDNLPQLTTTATKPAKAESAPLPHKQFRDIWEQVPPPRTPHLDDIEFTTTLLTGAAQRKHLELTFTLPGYSGTFSTVASSDSFDLPYGKCLVNHADFHDRIAIAYSKNQFHVIPAYPLNSGIDDPHPPLPRLLVATLLARLSASPEPYLPRRAVDNLIRNQQLHPQAIKDALPILLAGGGFSPAKAAYQLTDQPEYLPILWPLLTESIRYASTANPLPKWINRILDLVVHHLPYLQAATDQGLIPATDWEGLTALAESKKKSAAKAKATSVLSLLNPKKSDIDT